MSRSLQSELILSKFSVTMVVLVVCSGAFMVNDYLLFWQGLERRIEMTAKLVSTGLAAPLGFEDHKEAEKVLFSLRAEPSIISAVVYDAHNRQFASYGKDAALESPDSEAHLQREGTYAAWYPIRHEGEMDGVLLLRASTEELSALYRKYALIVLGVLAAGVFLSLVLARMTQRAISQPIQALLRVIGEVGLSGNYQVEIDEGQRISEIKSLAIEFNKMVRQVQRSEVALREANQSLEQKVEARTRELQSTQAALIESSKMSALGEMAAGIAHEINNPLTVIAGRASQMQDRIRSHSMPEDKVLEGLEKVVQMALRISRIIKGLRSFSRNAEKDPFAPSPFRPIVEETLELCRERFRNHEVDLRVGEMPEIELDCRAAQVSQALLNLLNNAHDAVFGSPSAWVELLAKIEAETLEIWITDSGHGIPPEIAEKIMQPFFTTKEVGKGTGLGLSISRGIIHDHHGQLTLDTKCANTRFVICLPLKQKETPSEPEAGSLPPSSDVS